VGSELCIRYSVGFAAAITPLGFLAVPINPFPG
jgi:hypothetical protein